MKFNFDKKYLYWGLTAFLVIAAGILFYYLIFHSSSLSANFSNLITIFMPIIDGLILGYVMTPVLNKVEKSLIKPLFVKKYGKSGEAIEKKQKLIRGLSILLTVLIVLSLVFWFFKLIIPQLIRSIQSIILQFPVYLNNLGNWTVKLLKDNPDLESAFNDFLDKYYDSIIEFIYSTVLPSVNSMIKAISISVIGFIKAAWNMIIGFIISIYIMGSKEKFAGQAKKLTFAIFQTKTANKLIDDMRFTHKAFSGFLIGKIIDSIIIGIITFICTSIVGTPYATLISVIVGVTNVIPFFGPYFGAIPSTLLILMVEPKQALYFVIMILIIQQFDGNILGPKILGDSTGLTGFWVIFSITLFGGFFGVFGMVIGVPVFAVFYAAVKRRTEIKLEEKRLPVATEFYLDVGNIDDEGNFTVYIPDENIANKKDSYLKKLINYIKKVSKKENK